VFPQSLFCAVCVDEEHSQKLECSRPQWPSGAAKDNSNFTDVALQMSTRMKEQARCMHASGSACVDSLHDMDCSFQVKNNTQV